MTATTEGQIQTIKQSLRSGRPARLHTLTNYNEGNQQEDEQYQSPPGTLESHRLLPKLDL